MKIRWDAKRKRWRVHYASPGSANAKPYSERSFRQKIHAETFAAEIEDQRRRMGDAWLALPVPVRERLIAAHELAEASGVDLVDAVKRTTAAPLTVRTLGDLVADLRRAKEAKGIRPRSVRALMGTIETFALGRQELTLDRVGPPMIREFLASRDWSPVRRRGVLRDLCTAFNHAVRNEFMPRNPCDAVERPVVEPKATPILSPEEIERLFRTCEREDPELLGFVALAAFGGFRAESEVARMTRADVLLALQTGAAAPPVLQKTRRRRVVPLTPGLRAWLEAWAPLGVEPCPVNFGKRWRRVRESAGLMPWPQNVLRHSRVSYRLAETGDEIRTAEEDGHSAAVLHRNYRALVTVEAAARYFAVMPTPGADYRAAASAARAAQAAKRTAPPEVMRERARKRWNFNQPSPGQGSGSHAGPSGSPSCRP